MVSPMRTTLTLDDDVPAKLRELAHRCRLPFSHRASVRASFQRRRSLRGSPVCAGMTRWPDLVGRPEAPGR
jgi:predicted transcriptional regulator